MNWRPTLFWVVSTCLGIGCGKSAEPLPIYFGHVATLTGPGKEAGEQAAHGIRIALQELNQVAKLRPFHVRHADAQGNPAAFESLAVRLTAVNNTAALYGGDTAEQVAKMDRAEAIVMSPAGHRPPGLGEQVYTIGLSPRAQGQALGQFAREELKKQVWLIIVDDASEEATLLARSFEETLSDTGGEDSKAIRPRMAKMTFRDVPDWREVSDPFPTEHVNAIMFAGSDKDLAQFWAKSKTKNDIVTLVGESLGPIVERPTTKLVYRPSSFWLDESRPNAAEFAKTYRETFKAEPTAEAALAYEGISLLGKAFRDAEQLTLEKVSETLTKTSDFPGLLGPLTIGKDRHLRRAVAIVQWSGKTAKLNKVYAPQE